MKPSLTIKAAAALMVGVSVPALASDFPLDCVYVAKHTAHDLQPHPNCASRTDSELRIAARHLSEMLFSSDKLAAVLVENQWYYIKPTGEFLPVLTFDNFADDFSEGLTRSLVDGKIAYFDHQLRQVISPGYDWGWPFKDGRALVCRGCRLAKVDDEGHRPLTGGKWGFIDKRGLEVVPVNLTQDEAMAK